jgi:hypothetical protein
MEHSQMSEFRSENSEMSDVASAQGMMRGFVDSRQGDNLKHKLWSAAAALGWPQSRAKAVLYGEARVIKAREMEELRKAAKVNREIGETADEYRELRDRLARMEVMLSTLVSHVAGASADRPQP